MGSLAGLSYSIDPLVVNRNSTSASLIFNSGTGINPPNPSSEKSVFLKRKVSDRNVWSIEYLHFRMRRRYVRTEGTWGIWCVLPYEPAIHVLNKLHTRIYLATLGLTIAKSTVPDSGISVLR